MRRTFEIIWILIILLAAVVLRIDFNLRYPAELFGDSVYMARFAEAVAQTGAYPTDFGIYWSPGVVYFLGWLIPLIGNEHNYLAYRLLQSVLSVSCLAGFYLLARLWFGRLPGMLALLLLAFYPPLVFYSSLIFAENLFFWLVPWLLLALYKWRETGGLFYPVMSGILFGLIHLVRPILIPLPVIFVVWFLLTKQRETYRSFFFRQIPACAIAGLLILTPWIAHNYALYGKVITSSAVGGLNFYIAHNEKANGKWVQVDVNSDVIKLAGTPEGEKRGYEEGWNYIRTHLDEELKLLGTKFSLFWTKTGQFWDGSATQFWEQTYGIPLIEMKYLTYLFLMFLVMEIRRWKSWFPLVGYVVAYQTMILVLYYADRYRSIVEPFLLIFAAVVLARVCVWLKQGWIGLFRYLRSVQKQGV
ncbi:ArnT family glycosyltransferase [Brevibacillus fulvus]|uniref:4-amino-4-deoxy-L-arabinose transferase-like glycosyltransferase n=1 Tax=Brevibacillus fulvus TaxID=1125967 RepID=A0A938Y436_9BACL|nr:glycosyltransferase family 39 protein [Brevibacillus fulvus]MBM7591237.1 4-amino-4-deoxy-L-arabinose transferase-like glycosyltransferase [Brevibacillus fulvus]